MKRICLLPSLMLVVACSGSTGNPIDNAGGSTDSSKGGKSGTTTNGQGGQSATQSSTSSSANPTGGSSQQQSSAQGGSNANGGAPAQGGSSTASGGTSNTKSANGGTTTTSKGGTTATSSSAKPTGGSSPAGGATTGNGGSVPGGAGPKGGTSATSSSAKPGGSANGGSATGGTTSTTPGGGTANNVCKNLSFAPGTTGTKPTGTAGGLKVLDWAGFKSAISYTFDDSNSSQIKNYQAMKDAGGHYTFYLQTGKTTESNDATWGTALKDGHELGNHTQSHGTTKSDADSAQTFIKSKWNVVAYAFAAPNGDAATKSFSSMFLTNRSVSGGSVGAGDTSSFSWLPSDIPPTDGSNMAPTAGKWRVLCIHGFQGGSDGAYQAIPLDKFTSAVKSAVSGGAWVETVSNVAAYNWGQNAIKAGTGNKVTWTLPSVFPPNMCVRVTTSGGTVKQKGVEVPWDSHGYYEISLDAQSLEIE